MRPPRWIKPRPRDVRADEVWFVVRRALRARGILNGTGYLGRVLFGMEPCPDDQAAETVGRRSLKDHRYEEGVVLDLGQVEVWVQVEVEPFWLPDLNRAHVLGAVFVDPSGVEPDEVLYFLD